MLEPDHRWKILWENRIQVIADVPDLLVRDVSQGVDTAQIVKAVIILASDELDPISDQTEISNLGLWGDGANHQPDSQENNYKFAYHQRVFVGQFVLLS